MNNPPDRSRQLLKRVAWTLVAAALLGAVIGIYLFLRPSPRRLADPEEFNLAEGERFVLEDLPMGSRYRLRACEHTVDVRVEIGTWASGWSHLAANPIDDRHRDLRVDGRSGGDMVLEARTATGRLLLFRDNMNVTCRGADPQDVEYRSKRLREHLPPFDCDETSLAGYDRQALELLRHELMSLPAGKPGEPPRELSEAEQSCVKRLQELALHAPSVGVHSGQPLAATPTEIGAEAAPTPPVAPPVVGNPANPPPEIDPQKDR